MKRVLKTAFAVALMLILTICTVHADEVLAEKKLLTTLGIVTEDELYRDGITTRAEFVVYALRLKNYSVTSGAARPQFTDVAKSYWAYNEISTAYSLGMIREGIGGRFDPDSPIEIKDAARILLCAMGYTDYVKNMSDANVMRLADSVKLFKGADKTTGIPMNKDSVFKALFNAMTIDMPFPGGVKADGSIEYHVKDGVNILSEYYDVHFTEGIVTADDNTVISGIGAGVDSMVINGDSYIAAGIDTDSWVGMNVGCYWRDNDLSREILAVYAERNTVDEFDFSVAEFLGTSFVEKVESKKITRRIDAKTTMLINGSVVRNNTQISDSLSGYAGNIKMIDNDHDGVYDVVILKRYINIRVGSYDDIEKILLAQNVLGQTNSQGQLLKFEYKLGDYKDVVIKDCFLKEINLTELQVDDIASLYLPLDKNHRVEIIMGGDSFSAELIKRENGKENDVYIVCDDDVAYKVSDYCLIDWNNIILGEDYAFYPDWRGDIVFADMKIADTQIGYLRRAYTSEDSGISQLNIFTSGGAMLTYDLKEKVSVRKSDGTTGSYAHRDVITSVLPLSADVHSSDGEIAAGNVKQPIMYKLTRDDKISKIWVLTDKQDLIFHKLDDDLSKPAVNADGVMTNYRFEYRTNNFMGKYLCTSDTTVFVVPRGSNNEEDYNIGSMSLFSNGTYVHFHNARQRLYMIAIEPDSFITDAVVYKIDYSKSKGVLAASVPVIYYKKIEMVNDDGEKVFKIFTLGHDGTEKTYEVVCDTLCDSSGVPLQYGDIIRIATDEKGKVVPGTIQTMYAASENSGAGRFYAYQGDTSAVRYLTSVRVIPATVVARQGNYIKIDTVYGIDPANEKGASKEIASVASAKVYVFEKQGKTLTESSAARIAPGDKFVLYEALGNPRMIVYYK